MPEPTACIRPLGGLLTPDDVSRLAEYTLHTGAHIRFGPHATVSVIGPESGPAQPLPDLDAPLSVATAPRWHVVCSPLTGRAGGMRDVRPLAVRVAERLSRWALPESESHTSGRSVRGSSAPLFAIDDGRCDVASGGSAGGGSISGDVSSEGAAIELVARNTGGYALRISGEATGVRIGDDTAEQTCATVAELRGDGASTAEIVDRLAPERETDVGGGDDCSDPSPAAAQSADDDPAVAGPSAAAPIGWIAHDVDDRVTLGAVVDGGRLEGERLQFVAAIGCPVIVGPAESLLLCDLDEWAAEQVVRVLAPMGFVFDADSPILRGTHLPGG